MDEITNLTERIAVYRHLRTRSDAVRTRMIPDAVREGTPAEQIFYDMT